VVASNGACLKSSDFDTHQDNYSGGGTALSGHFTALDGVPIPRSAMSAIPGCSPLAESEAYATTSSTCHYPMADTAE